MSKQITTRLRFHWVLAAALTAILWGLVPAGTSAQEIFSGTTFGPIEYRVVMRQLPPGGEIAEVGRLIERTLEDVDARMSTWREDSEVSRFNAFDSTDWFEVSPATAEVVTRALEISRLSDGAFDITVAPLVNLWGFGPGRQPPAREPTMGTIEQILERVGWTQLEVRLSPPALRKAHPELQIDLSAIAKGYGVDQVVRALREIGAENFLVEIGGDLYADGRRLPNTQWRIGIESPIESPLVEERQVHRVALVENRGMASSGDYRTRVEVEGQQYAHIMDPRTGRPVDNDMASATVVADDCITADALATAVMVLGREQGMELCIQMGAELHIIRQVQGMFAENMTDDFPIERARPKRANLWPMVVAALVVFVLAVVAMAVGVIFSNRRIRGSCGGLNQMRDATGAPMCGVCSNPQTDCRDDRWRAAVAGSQSDDEDEEPDKDEVEEASEESFPASDPPAWVDRK